ncbi:MAG: DegT/DnrJ/EryC1/StrS aminotransferase family protein [bacterium]
MNEFIPWARPDIGEEEVNAVAEAVKSTWIGGNGPLTKEFEEGVSKKLNVDYVIAVANGTLALICSLQALMKGKPEPVVGVPTFTFIATVNSAFAVGTPVLFDLDVSTWNMEKYIVSIDEKKLSSLDIIMPVDVGGNPVNYDEMKKLGLPIVADSAEAIGASYKGKPIGSQADIHCFSLHSAKIITTGEGGLITTNNIDLYDQMRSIVNQGYAGNKRPWEYLHQNIGFNYRMTEMQSAIGLVQLKKLDKYVKERNEMAHIYRDIIGDKASYQVTTKDSIHPYFIFGILIKNQIEFCKEMFKNNIQVKVTFKPAHKQPCYRHLFGYENLPDSERIARKIVSLPIWNGLGEEKVKYIAETARRLLK